MIKANTEFQIWNELLKKVSFYIFCAVQKTFTFMLIIVVLLHIQVLLEHQLTVNDELMLFFRILWQRAEVFSLSCTPLAPEAVKHAHNVTLPPPCLTILMILLWSVFGLIHQIGVIEVWGALDIFLPFVFVTSRMNCYCAQTNFGKSGTL